MSEIRVDDIKDAAGTGAPDFPNGLSNNGESIVTVANTPMFDAYVSVSSSTYGTGTTQTVVYDTESLDHTGAYDNTTGIFTAPSAGLYAFSAAIRMVSQGSTVTRFQSKFVSTGTDLLISDANWLALTTGLAIVENGVAIFKLAATDTVKVQVFSQGANWRVESSGTAIRFSGVKLK